VSPIANCGFPPLLQVPGTDPVRFVTGSEVLVWKGPTLGVDIGFNQEIFHPDPAIVQQAIASVHARPPARFVEALIDTGASESCIDEDLAKELQLPLIDQAKGSGISGSEEFNIYLGYIRIAALGFLQYGRFMGVKLRAGNQPHQALLGRSLFKDMLLVYDGRDGSVRLAI
jgi:predicted aspartyl protease